MNAVRINRKPFQLFTILFLILIGLIIGVSLGILFTSDISYIMSIRIIGASIIGLLIGVLLGVIFTLQSQFDRTDFGKYIHPKIDNPIRFKDERRPPLL